MAFAIPYGRNGIPKLLLATAAAMLAVKEFCQSVLQFFGLGRERDDTAVVWRYTDETDAQFLAAISKLRNYAGAIRESLPPVLFRRVLEKNLEREDVQCAVCLFDVGPEQEVRQLPYCSHLFHKECIDQWLDHNHKSCPLCRSSLVREELAQRLKGSDWNSPDEMNSWFENWEELRGSMDWGLEGTGQLQLLA